MANTFTRIEDKFGDKLDIQTDSTSPEACVSLRFIVKDPALCPYICLDKEASIKLRDVLIAKLPLDKE